MCLGGPYRSGLSPVEPASPGDLGSPLGVRSAHGSLASSPSSSVSLLLHNPGEIDLIRLRQGAQKPVKSGHILFYVRLCNNREWMQDYTHGGSVQSPGGLGSPLYSWRLPQGLSSPLGNWVVPWGSGWPLWVWMVPLIIGIHWRSGVPWGLDGPLASWWSPGVLGSRLGVWTVSFTLGGPPIVLGSPLWSGHTSGGLGGTLGIWAVTLILASPIGDWAVSWGSAWGPPGD